MPMHTREIALGWLGLGILALPVILIPAIVLMPALRFGVGVILFLAGLFARGMWRVVRR
jgi:hypothetical protein